MLFVCSAGCSCILEHEFLTDIFVEMHSRNYSEMCAKFMQILRQMLHFLQFLCMQIGACHLSKCIITSSFILWNIIHLGLCFQQLLSCPALYFVMDPHFGIKLNLLLDL